MTQQTSGKDSQTTTAPCSRCGAEIDVRHMFRLEDGRRLCRACRSIVLGARRQRQRQERARKRAERYGESPPPVRKTGPRYMPTDANDAAADVLATGTAAGEGGSDEMVPCPECGAKVLVYVPRCDACEADLSEYWEHEEFVHPPSLLRRGVRIGVRIAIIVALLAVGLMALPAEKRKNYFDSILPERFVGPGRGIGDQTHGVEIHPALTRTGTSLTIRNDDPFHWDSVEVSLNSTRGRGGYKAQILRRIWSGSTQEMPLAHFRKTDGQQFMTEGLKIETVTIEAETPRGKAYWSRPFIDATQDTTPQGK